MLRPMKLEGALKLYIAMYALALAFTFLISVPMLSHVAPKSECLLFTSMPPITYGSAGGCVITGILPILVAVCALGLIFLHWVQLKKLREHIKLPEITSEEFRQGFKKTFWKMIVVHGVVVGVVVTLACILTAGYATSCMNLYQDIKTKLRSRIDHTPQQNRGGGNQQRHEIFADDHTIYRYTNDNLDILGRNKFEESITCRSIFTDERVHYDLKTNTAKDPYYASIYGFWNNQNNLVDTGNFRHIAYRDNLVLEISLAGAWISLFLWVLMLLLMLKERHHLKAFITDESMWGGSEFGAGSVRSGRSRKSSNNGRLMSPVDFENMDRMSHHSKMSFDRSSKISRASRGSRGTSYKDMGGKRHSSAGGSNSYKVMNGRDRRSSAPPSQLTVSRLEKVPEVDTGYTVNRLLNGNPHLNHGDFGDNGSVADMSVMTVTGAIIGPGANQQRNSEAKRPGLMDFFSAEGQQPPASTSTPEKKHMLTSESDVI